MASATFGVLSIIGIYLLAKELFDNKTALLSALFLAISPWHLVFSRQANDAGFLLPLIIFALWSFFKGLNKYPYLIISVVLFSLSFYSYATAAVFTPLLVFIIIIKTKKQLLSLGARKVATLVIVGAIVLTPFVNSSFGGTTTERFRVVSVFSDENISHEVAIKRLISNSVLTRLFYNQKTVVFVGVLKNYINAYSTRFLFTHGDPSLRNSIGGMGMLYYFDLIFIMIGFFVVVFKYFKKNKKPSILFFWLLISAIPSAMTSDGANHAGRLLVMLPPLIILSSVGFLTLFNFLWVRSKKLSVVILAAVMLVNIVYYFNRYYVIWPYESWRFWQSGYKEMFAQVRAIEANYENIYFNNTYEPTLPRFLFWYEYDSDLFQAQFTDDKHIKDIVDGFNGFKLGDKYFFGEVQKPVEGFLSNDSLVVASARDDITDPSILKNSNIKLLSTVYSPGGMPIFYLISSK
jgi:4-amino-4-deoxy-L-arabinose transferase-like glycosyltransferase